jgi:hypothetical protein
MDMLISQIDSVKNGYSISQMVCHLCWQAGFHWPRDGKQSSENGPDPVSAGFYLQELK